MFYSLCNKRRHWACWGQGPLCGGHAGSLVLTPICSEDGIEPAPLMACVTVLCILPHRWCARTTQVAKSESQPQALPGARGASTPDFTRLLCGVAPLASLLSSPPRNTLLLLRLLVRNRTHRMPQAGSYGNSICFPQHIL